MRPLLDPFTDLPSLVPLAAPAPLLVALLDPLLETLYWSSFYCPPPLFTLPFHWPPFARAPVLIPLHCTTPLTFAGLHFTGPLSLDHSSPPPPQWSYLHWSQITGNTITGLPFTAPPVLISFHCSLPFHWSLLTGLLFTASPLTTPPPPLLLLPLVFSPLLVSPYWSPLTDPSLLLIPLLVFLLLSTATDPPFTVPFTAPTYWSPRSSTFAVPPPPLVVPSSLSHFYHSSNPPSHYRCRLH